MIRTWRETHSEYVEKQGEVAILEEIANIFSFEKIRTFFGSNHRVWVAVNKDHQMVGYSHVLFPSEKGKSAFLHHLYISKEEQGKGLGKRLIQKCYNFARRNIYLSIKLEFEF